MPKITMLEMLAELPKARARLLEAKTVENGIKKKSEEIAEEHAKQVAKIVEDFKTARTEVVAAGRYYMDLAKKLEPLLHADLSGILGKILKDAPPGPEADELAKDVAALPVVEAEQPEEVAPG